MEEVMNLHVQADGENGGGQGLVLEVNLLLVLKMKLNRKQ